MQHGIIIRVRMRPCFLSSSGARVGYMRIRHIWAHEILHTLKPCSAARNWSICTDGSFIARLISSYEFYFFPFFCRSLCLAVLGLERFFHVIASAFDGFKFTPNDILTVPTATCRSLQLHKCNASPTFLIFNNLVDISARQIIMLLNRKEKIYFHFNKSEDN